MTRVSNILLCTAHSEVNAMMYLQEWLADNNRFALRRVSSEAGGDKHMDCAVFAGAYDHFDEDAFVNKVFEIDWIEPGAVRVLIQSHEDTAFTLRVLNNTPEGFVADMQIKKHGKK